MLRYLTLALLIPINTISAIEHYELYEGLDKQEIQSKLGRNETYIIPTLDMIFTIDSEKIDSFEICKNEIEASIESLEQAVESFSSQPFAYDLRSYDSLMQELHLILIAPFEKDLRFKVKIIQNSHFSSIPWNALLSENGAYMIDRHEITIVKSKRSIGSSPRLLKEHKVHVLAPAFEGSLALASADEKKFIVNIWPNIQNEISTSNIIHVSSHSSLDSTSWGKSGIRLPNNKVLSNDEISRMNLCASLVFLNICNGANIEMAEKSIADAFHQAGTENIIATLWEIDDQMAISIAKDFYVNLINGQSSSTALRNCLLAYKEEKSKVGQFNPLYWSAYQCYGGDVLIAKNSNRSLKNISSIALSIGTSFSILYYYFGNRLKSKILDYNLV